MGSKRHELDKRGALDKGLINCSRATKLSHLPNQQVAPQRSWQRALLMSAKSDPNDCAIIINTNTIWLAGGDCCETSDGAELAEPAARIRGV